MKLVNSPRRESLHWFLVEGKTMAAIPFVLACMFVFHREMLEVRHELTLICLPFVLHSLCRLVQFDPSPHFRKLWNGEYTQTQTHTHTHACIHLCNSSAFTQHILLITVVSQNASLLRVVLLLCFACRPFVSLCETHTHTHTHPPPYKTTD